MSLFSAKVKENAAKKVVIEFGSTLCSVYPNSGSTIVPFPTGNICSQLFIILPSTLSFQSVATQLSIFLFSFLISTSIYHWWTWLLSSVQNVYSFWPCRAALPCLSALSTCISSGKYRWAVYLQYNFQPLRKRASISMRCKLHYIYPPVNYWKLKSQTRTMRTLKLINSIFVSLPGHHFKS